MVVLADITAGSKRQLGYPQLVFAVDLGQKTPERRFEIIFATKPCVLTLT